MNRRSFLKTAAVALAGGAVVKKATASEIGVNPESAARNLAQASATDNPLTRQFTDFRDISLSKFYIEIDDPEAPFTPLPIPPRLFTEEIV